MSDTTASHVRSSVERVRETDRPRNRYPNVVGAVLLAISISCLTTGTLIVEEIIPLWAAVPIYGLTGAAITAFIVLAYRVPRGN